MPKSGFYSIFFFLLTLPFFLFGENEKSDSLIQRADELYLKATQLNREDKITEALDTMLLSLTYLNLIYGKEDPALVRVYNPLGILYRRLGQIDKSLESYQLTESNYKLRSNVNYSTLARLYINIGNAYSSKLDYSNALNYYNQALNIFENQDSPDTEYLSDALYAIAQIYTKTNRDIEAENILIQNYNNTDTLNRIYFSELLGIIYQKLDNYQLAEKYYQVAIKLTMEYFGENDIELATEYMKYAEFMSEIKNFEHGLKTLEQAFQIISIYQSSKGSVLAEYYEYKGDLYKRKNIETLNILAFRQERKANLQEAIYWYNKSLNALYTGNNEAKIENLTLNNSLSFTDCLVLLKSIADTYYELAILDREEKNSFYEKSLLEALDYYNVISQLVQRARQEISNDESKIQLAELEFQTFTKTIETAYMAYELNAEEKYLELAFSNSEQIKSSAVFDKISNDLAQENSLIPDSLLELENKLNSTISFYNEKLFSAEDSVLIEEYNTKIFEAGRKRDELNRLLEDDYPDYYDLKYSKSLLSISQIQNKLTKKDALIEYVLYEADSTQELFTFLITKEHKILKRQLINTEMKQSMEYFFRFMTSSDYIFTTNEESKAFCVAANTLYETLIEPFAEEILNKNLIIIPDGHLNYLSFDGLLKTLPDTSQQIDFTKLDFLLHDFNINYANSANILLKHNNSKKSLRNATLAFAPEYASEKFNFDNTTFTLTPLPGVQKEVSQISKYVITQALTGSNASEENFRKASPDYDILHLAMHAFINDSLPAFSRLAFSPEPVDADIQKDGWLNTADIYNLNLKNVRLSVLSACNTGIGRMQKGEGLMSLARGFLYAGCPSIIMSLWEVEDNAGTQIMASFYRNIKKGKTKDAALRAAKLEYLANANSRLAHPHYWMSFRSIGDNSPIYHSSDIYFFAVLIAMILYFAVDQGIRLRKAHRKRQAS